MLKKSVDEYIAVPAWVIALAGSVSCAHFALSAPKCPAEGGPEWRAFSGAGFVLETDYPAEEARELALEIQRERAALAAVPWGPLAPPPGQVEIVALSTESEFTRYFADIWAGLSVTDLFGPLVVINGGARAKTRDVVAHELAHAFARNSSPQVPVWFAEGLASYLETASVEGDRSAVFGRLPHRSAELEALPLQPVPELFGWGRQFHTPNPIRLYVTAWLLVDYLIQERRDAFVDLQRRLQRGESFEQAWSIAFPSLTATELDSLLGAYEKRHRENLIRTHAAELGPAPQERQMADTEVHLLRARFMFKRKDVLAEGTEVLRQDPKNGAGLLYRVMLGATTRSQQIALAKEAITLAPDEWPPWVALAVVLPSDASAAGERQDALERAVTLAKGNIAPFRGLAAEYVQDGKFEEALAVAAKARALAPLDSQILTTEALAYFRLGQCANCLASLDAAMNALPDHIRDQKIPRLQMARTAFAKECAAGAHEAPLPAPMPETPGREQ